MHDRTNGRRPEVAVIIPTACEASRSDALRRAIHSVTSQQGVAPEVIVVVNGSRVCEELFQELRSQGGLRVVRQSIGSLPAAQRHGRSLVTKEYFTLLDDDDELLPDALRIRSRELERDGTVDVVVSNGCITFDGISDQLHVRNFDHVREDPLSALMRENWLVSCAALFRTRTIPLEFFDGVTKYHEWTLLAVRILLARRRLVFLDQPTFRKHEESAGSLSKSDAYRSSTLDFLTSLLALDMPRRTRVELKKKIGRELHGRSEHFRRRGELLAAWKYHLCSMNHPENWKYLPYTRKLLAPGSVGSGSEARSESS